MLSGLFSKPSYMFELELSRVTGAVDTMLPWPALQMMYHCSDAYTAAASANRPAMRRKLLRQPQGTSLEDWRDAQAARAIPAFPHQLHRKDAPSQQGVEALPSSAVGVPSSSAAVLCVRSAPSTGAQGQNSSPNPVEIGSTHGGPSMGQSKSPIGRQHEGSSGLGFPGGDEVTSPSQMRPPVAFIGPQPKLVLARRRSKSNSSLHKKVSTA